MKDKSAPGPTIALTLPGKVLDANEKGVVEGTKVRWSFTLAEWFGRKSWELTTRYRSKSDAKA